MISILFFPHAAPIIAAAIAPATSINAANIITACFIEVPSIEFQNLGLSIDGEEKNINQDKSSVYINGNQYYSKEFVDNLLPNDKVATVKDGMFYVGKIVKEKTNLLDMPIIENEYYSYFYDSMKDTYGNTYSKVLMFEYSNNFTTFNAPDLYFFLLHR